MPWIKLDENIRTHPKILRAGPLASWFWICGLSYCNEWLTDGFIPDDAIESLGVPGRYKPRELADRLCAANLWVRAPTGYQIHNYHEFQPTREEVERIREERRKAGRAGGLRSGAARHIKANGKQIASFTVEANEANGQAKSNPVPVPVPVREERSRTPSGARALSSRASTLIPSRNPAFVNPGDPVPLWDWQFGKFRDALTPKFGDEAYTKTLAWVTTVGEALRATGTAAPASDPVAWWNDRYKAEWEVAANPYATFLNGTTAAKVRA